MKKTITLVALCAFGVSSMLATNSSQMKIKKIEQLKSAREMFFPKRYRAVIMPEASQQANEGTAIIWEDFAKFSEGSETSPTPAEVNDQMGLIPSQYTQMPGWGGAGIHQSGGSAYIGFIKSPYGEDTGFITTPPADLSGNSGTYTIRFRARSVLTEGDELLISNFDPESSTPYISSTAIVITNEWTEYTVEMNQGIEKSRL